jgi:arylsulfatase A-like enzyme
VPIPSQNGNHPVHGLSLLPHLKSGTAVSLPDRYLFWDLYGKMAAVHGNWKIVGAIDNHHGKWAQALPQIEQAKFELYNLATDLSEQRDVAEQHPEIYRDLKQRYATWFRAATQ